MEISLLFPQSAGLTQAAVGHHDVDVTATLLASLLAPVLDADWLVGLNHIGNLELWYCRMPSLVPMQLLVPDGSGSHLPLCTLMYMLSLPQNMATWGSANRPRDTSVGT
ncbi:hypothetical protein EYF80_049457 [Liparis tanakae]|uniref:Uncharacterized protein n=1 Tax=Liparis tanakae TaxID=230148 RepID=A0A4Z2FGR1_9TELE|nr:hypothetical protein EYF80_049457 [Liparis tanakae]